MISALKRHMKTAGAAVLSLLKYGDGEDGGRWRLHLTNYTAMDKKGDFPIHGKLSLHIGANDDRALAFSWDLWASFFHAGVRTDRDDGDVTIFGGIAPIAVWLSIAPSKAAPLIQRLGDREVRVSAHDGCVWWSLWMNPDEWRSEEPRWRRGSFDVASAFLGEMQVTREPLDESVRVQVPTPEGVYEGTCTMTYVRVGRPRWISSGYRTAQIDLDTPIPIPGKGENSWDCDEDHISAQSGPAKTPADAVANLVSSVMLTRERRASRDWQPEKPAPRPIAQA